MAHQSRRDTLLAHSDIEHGQPGAPVSPPVFRQSTLRFASVQALDAVRGTAHTYGRHGSPTTRALEARLSELEGAAGAMLTSCGLSAITTALLALVKPGDHILMTDSAYEPTRSFCDETLARLGVQTTYYDPLVGAGLEALMRPETRLVFTESPGSLSFEVQDIPAISEVAHRHGALVLLDNTWGTPLYFRSFAHGVDVSLHSASKYIGGHADLLMGVILATEALLPRLRRAGKQLGVSVAADDAYLALRGLRTLSARLERHARSALAVAHWLQHRPEVARVLYPALPGAPGHPLWKRDFDGACGLFGIVLHPVSKAAVDAMLDGLALFAMGFSWGGFESLVLPGDPSHVRTATRWQAEGPLLRLHIGLEDVDDLIDDLKQGFARLHAATQAPAPSSTSATKVKP